MGSIALLQVLGFTAASGWASPPQELCRHFAALRAHSSGDTFVKIFDDADYSRAYPHGS